MQMHYFWLHIGSFLMHHRVCSSFLPPLPLPPLFSAPPPPAASALVCDTLRTLGVRCVTPETLRLAKVEDHASSVPRSIFAESLCSRFFSGENLTCARQNLTWLVQQSVGCSICREHLCSKKRAGAGGVQSCPEGRCRPIRASAQARDRCCRSLLRIPRSSRPLLVGWQ